MHLQREDKGVIFTLRQTQRENGRVSRTISIDIEVSTWNIIFMVVMRMVMEDKEKDDNEDNDDGEDDNSDGDPSKDKDKKDGDNNDETEDDHNDEIEGDNNDDIEDKNNDADPSKEAIAFLVLLFLCTAWKRPVLLQSGDDYNQNLIDNIKNHNQIVVKE